MSRGRGGHGAIESVAIELAPRERDALERLAASRTAPAGRVQRAQAILAAVEGQSNAAIARRLGRHLDTVRRWRKRFTAERLAAVSDRPRPRGRPKLTPQERVQIIAAATSAPPGAGTVWTHQLLAEHLALAGVAVVKR